MWSVQSLAQQQLPISIDQLLRTVKLLQNIFMRSIVKGCIQRNKSTYAKLKKHIKAPEAVDPLLLQLKQQYQNEYCADCRIKRECHKRYCKLVQSRGHSSFQSNFSEILKSKNKEIKELHCSLEGLKKTDKIQRVEVLTSQLHQSKYQIDRLNDIVKRLRHELKERQRQVQSLMQINRESKAAIERLTVMAEQLQTEKDGIQQQLEKKNRKIYELKLSKQRFQNNYCFQKISNVFITEHLQSSKAELDTLLKRTKSDLYKIAYMVVLRLRHFCSSKKLYLELLSSTLNERVTVKGMAQLLFEKPSLIRFERQMDSLLNYIFQGSAVVEKATAIDKIRDIIEPFSDQEIISTKCIEDIVAKLQGKAVQLRKQFYRRNAERVSINCLQKVLKEEGLSSYQVETVLVQISVHSQHLNGLNLEPFLQRIQ